MEADARRRPAAVRDVDDEPGFVRRLAGEVELQAVDGRRVLAVTHLDVGRDDIEPVVAAAANLLT